jgi:hypothetical protein
MTTPSQGDELPTELTAAEAELIERLEEACAMEPQAPGAEDTGELEKLEETLRAATKAAERAVRLRRQRHADLDVTASGVRDFRDRDGREWRAWAVIPQGRQAKKGSLEQLRPEYQSGWLTFETTDESERRRLPSYPKDWAKGNDADLQQLLASARPVSPRRRKDEHPEGPNP